jgi:hypothetical protein
MVRFWDVIIVDIDDISEIYLIGHSSRGGLVFLFFPSGVAKKYVRC